MKMVWTLLGSLLAMSAHAQSCDDIHKQRAELVARASYKPLGYVMFERQLITLHKDRLNEGVSIQQAMEPLEVLLKAQPMNIWGMWVMSAAYERLSAQDGLSSQAKAHFRGQSESYKAKGDTLVNCVLATGDGQSEQTAYQVINVSEQYALLQHKGFKAVSRHLVDRGDRQFDVFQVSRDGQPAGTVHMEVTSFFGR